jgi:predicted oxidoreductase
MPILSPGGTMPLSNQEQAAYLRDAVAKIREKAAAEPDSVIKAWLNKYANDFDHVIEHLENQPPEGDDNAPG